MAKPKRTYDTIQEYNEALALLEKIKKSEKGLSGMEKDRLKLLKKEKNLLKELSEDFKYQADLAKKLAKKMKGINASEFYLLRTSALIVKYGALKDKNAQKLAKSLSLVVDASATIQQNMEEIGTSEFQSLNLSKLIFNLKKQNKHEQDKEITDQIKYLQGQQALQEKLQKAHDITTETAAQFLKPVKYMQDLIGQIPIVGGLLSKMIPVDKWEDDIKRKITGSLKEAFGIKEIDTPEKSIEATTGQMELFGDETLKTDKKAGKLLEVSSKMGEVQSDTTKETNKTAKGMGKVNIKAMLVGGGLAIIVGLAAKAALSMFNFANETGISYKQTIKLGGALLINAEAVKALTEEFGNINGITTMMAVDMKILNKQYGISAATSAKILKLQTATSGQTKRQLLNVQKEVAQMARLEGVTPDAVFESMAADSEAFAKFTKDSGKNLMKMAIQAKKVGVEMASILGAMESSLDLESSINAQFEASLLLGRDINLDKFRQLSLTGDALGAQKEIVRLVGSESEWNSMNLIQRIALAKAVGLQVAEVSKIVGAQNAVNKVTEEGNKTNWTMFAIVTAIGAVLLGIVGALLAATFQGGRIAKMGAGGLKGAGIGAGIGAIGYAGFSAMKAQAPDVSGATMNRGTVANVRRGEMTIHKGETSVHTQDFSMKVVEEELRGMRKDMRVGGMERAEQSRQQINIIRGIGANGT